MSARFLMVPALLLSLIGAAHADDGAASNVGWPFLRGPRFDGHVRGVELVDAFPPEGPPVLWTRPLGQGYSGFTAAGGRVVTQYQTLGGQFVLCLDADTGETLWEHRYNGPWHPAGLYPGPRATPTLADGRVYFAGPAGLVGCLSMESGRRLWSLDVFEHFQVELVEFGYSCSPVVIDGMVLLPVGGPGASMVALDAKTGQVVWHSGDDAASHVPAFPIEFDGRPLVIGYLRNVLAAFDRRTGEVVWRWPLSSGYDEHAAWPIYREPYLWISGPFRAGSELLELTANPPGVRPVWKSELLSNDVCSSVLVDGHLYGFDIRDVQAKPHRPSRGWFRCVEFLTGEERWTNGTPNARRSLDDEPAEGAPVGQATVLAADGKLILFNDTGELILARATPERYEELGRVRVLGGEIGWTQPALSGGRLYVRNHSRAACLVLGESVDADDVRPRLTVADIPQSEYRDWAAVILPVEPEYAMDPPTLRQMAGWFGVCALILLAAAVISAGMTWLSGRLLRPTPGGTGQLGDLFRGWLTVLAFSAGALGTTLASGWAGEFIFTWPLCLFVVFAAVARRASRSEGAWTDYAWLSAFVLLGVGYFLICRRLGLAFEWTFLGGFPAAVPFVMLSRRVPPNGWRAVAGESALTLLGFAAFYWMSAGVLVWRYA